jgi:hypothetical protein
MLRYLAQLADRADLPEFERSLKAADGEEVQAALHGLVALRATHRRPDIQKLARKAADPKIRATAQAALEKLAGRRDEP